jgi:hypothetical protein
MPIASTIWIAPTAVAASLLALLVWPALARSPVRLAQRLGLWAAALFFTFYGPFSAESPDWPTAWAWEINVAHDFKDLRLSMTGMLVFSLSNVADNLLRSYAKLSNWCKFLLPFILVIYLVGIVLGITAYHNLAEQTLDPTRFAGYWHILLGVVALGVLPELLIVSEVTED